MLPVPAITSLSARSGVAGSTLTIYGQNFSATQGSGYVFFQGFDCAPYAQVTSWSASAITVIVPPGEYNGALTVYVVSGAPVNQASNFVSYTLLPSINGVIPSSGPVGSAVSVYGSALVPLSGSPSVTFHGVAAAAPTSSMSCSGDVLSTTIPTGATSGSVVVSGSGLVSNPVPFTVN